MRRKFLACLAGGLFSFLVAGCIAVDDFGEFWNRGFIDNCVNDIINRQQASDRPSNIAQKSLLLRSLRLGNHTFLMMRDDMQHKGGNMMRYKIDSGDYVSYRLNESKREDFVRDYPDSGVVLTTETATVPVLNADSVALISKVADDDGYWVESHREPYNPNLRSDCIQTLY